VLKKAETANWLVLTMPKFIFRDRISVIDILGRPVRFKERFVAYTSAVYALGALALQSQKNVGWPTRITDRRTCRVTPPKVTAEGQAGRTPLAAALSEDRMTQLLEIGVTALSAEAASSSLYLNRAVTLAGGTLAYQLFANRVLCFFYQQRETIGREGGVRSPENLTAALEQAFFQSWRETGQPDPDDFVIGIACEEPGEVILSIRMTPPKVLVPETKRFEFDLAFTL
jgi:hypothetical protein